MAHDEELAGRIRAALSLTGGVTEKRMFGGLGFMVDGHMVAAADSAGELMLRVDPAEAPGLVDGDVVRHVRMRGRELAGWLVLAPSAVADERELRDWLQRGLACVRTLPSR